MNGYKNYIENPVIPDDINYEVEVECCGETKTMFIDENDAMASDF